MVAAARNPGASYAGRTLAFQRLSLAAALLAFSILPAHAQVAARQDGLFISVRNPIDSDVVNSIKAKTRRALERKDRPIRFIISHFTPSPGHPHPTPPTQYTLSQH